MSKTCFLLGGDERQRWAAQALLDAGLEVRCCGVPGMPEALPAPADFVILPFPALQGERLRGTAAPERTAVSPAAAAVRGSMAAGSARCGRPCSTAARSLSSFSARSR